MFKSYSFKRIAYRFIALFVVIPALNGCSILPQNGRAERDSFLLSLDVGAGSIAADLQNKVDEKTLLSENTAPLPARILLEQDNLAAAGGSTRILFISGKNTLGSYQFAQWAEAPVNVFHRTLFDKLKYGGQVADVAISSGLIKNDYLVRFRIDKFWLDNSSPKGSYARAEVSLTVIDIPGRRTLGRRTFLEEVIVTNPSPETTVKALSEAGSQVVRDGIGWIIEILSKEAR